MNEDTFNMQIRKFLKKVGVTSQREIEQAVRGALESGNVSSDASIPVVVTLKIPDLDLSVDIEGTLDLE
ncbi:MAG: DUF6494 family protein [Pseudomonadota bacterium]